MQTDMAYGHAADAVRYEAGSTEWNEKKYS